MTYSEKLNILVKNTIEYYSNNPEITRYQKYYNNINHYNKIYKNKVDLFFSENNIEQDSFFKCFDEYRALHMLKKLEGNTSNIIYNFSKYFVTEQAIDDRLNGHYSGFKPTLNSDMINHIRYCLFNNDYNSELLTLEEQNNLLHNYVHFDAGMKKIKTVK